MAIDLSAGTLCGIEVEFADVPEHLAGATSVGTHVEATDSSALVRMPGVRLLVSGGDRIVMDVDPSLARESSRYVLYGWAASLVMLQRGYYFLHASTVTRGGQTIAITGASGAGKSTTVLNLVSQGWELCCDDTSMTVLRDGRAWVVPYKRPIHVVPGAEPDLVFSHDLPFRTKTAFTVPQNLSPRPITAVVELRPTSGMRKPTMRHVEGAESMGLLERNMHAWRAARTPGRARDLMTWLVGTASATRLFRLERPLEGDSMAEVCALVAAAGRAEVG